MNIWLNFLIDSLAFGATFMYGSTGEILTEKAGHLNLGIPGIMCMGGAGGCLILNLIVYSSDIHPLQAHKPKCHALNHDNGIRRPEPWSGAAG